MRLSIHPLFIIFVILAILSGFGGLIFALVFAVVIHEYGHVIMASKFGIRTKKIRLLPFGAQIEIESKFLDTKSRVLILLAGSFANIIVALSCGLLLWLFPEHFLIWESFIIANAIPAIFNLLPIYPLDGGKILHTLFGGKNFTKAIRVISTIIFGVLFLVGILISFNPMLILMSGVMIFMLNAEFRGSEFTSKFNKPLTQCGKITEVAITSEMSLLEIYKLIEKNYTKFIVVDRQDSTFYEKELEQWLTKFPSNITLVEILESTSHSGTNNSRNNRQIKPNGKRS